MACAASISIRISSRSRWSRATAINDNIAVAFVRGFGMKRGAIASSVGHDSHNICVVGANEADMAVAVNRLIEIEGGFVVAEGGKVIAELALPVAGLMSLMSFEEVHEALIPLRAAAKSLGVVLAEPFLQVAFLPLPVIPHLKITDMGLSTSTASNSCATRSRRSPSPGGARREGERAASASQAEDHQRPAGRRGERKETRAEKARLARSAANMIAPAAKAKPATDSPRVGR